MVVRGYQNNAPDLEKQRAMWAKAEAAPKDARGVTIDVEAQKEAAVPMTEKKTAPEMGGLGVKEKGSERAALREKLRQLEEALKKEEAALSYDRAQIQSLREHLKANNAHLLGPQIRGFESDAAMRIQTAAGYRRQMDEVRTRMARGETTYAAAA